MHSLPADDAGDGGSGACAPGDSAQRQLQTWRHLTRHALSAQSRGDADGALHGFRESLAVAEPLLLAMVESAALPAPDELPDTARFDDALAAFVVAHHNLSDLLERLDRPDEAVQHLCDAHLQLLALDAPAQPAPLRAAAWRHLGETRRALILWRHRHEVCDERAALVDEALAAVALDGLAH